MGSSCKFGRTERTILGLGERRHVPSMVPHSTHFPIGLEVNGGLHQTFNASEICGGRERLKKTFPMNAELRYINPRLRFVAGTWVREAAIARVIVIS